MGKEAAQEGESRRRSQVVLLSLDPQQIKDCTAVVRFFVVCPHLQLWFLASFVFATCHISFGNSFLHSWHPGHIVVSLLMRTLGASGQVYGVVQSCLIGSL